MNSEKYFTIEYHVERDRTIDEVLGELDLTGPRAYAVDPARVTELCKLSEGLVGQTFALGRQEACAGIGEAQHFEQMQTTLPTQAGGGGFQEREQL